MLEEDLYRRVALEDPNEDWYANQVWGRRLVDDNSLFEVMSLQVFQAGLTWKMILAKRDAFREAFANWDIDVVAGMGPDDVCGLCQNARIIRNRMKIQATIDNACIIQDLKLQYGSFCHWFYEVLLGDSYPCLRKQLRSKFRFMGPELSRMWLMAAGRITREEGAKYRP